MIIKFFQPSLAYKKHRQQYLDEFDRILSAGDLILRQDVEEFEKNFASFVGKKYCVGLNSGTDALYLSLWALGIGKDDEVIVPSHTFVASVQVINQLGATPVLVDMDETWDTFVTEKTKALLPTHIAGATLGWKPTGIPIIEDACQALGAVGVGKGLIQCWSFYPAKILGAYGDAGAITTDDESLANEIRELRNHYKKDYSKWGINSRMDNLQAAILNIKLKYLPKAINRRAEVAERYYNGLKNLEKDGKIKLPNRQIGRVYQDFIVRTEQRDTLFEYLKEHGIETMKNEYPMPIKKLPRAKQYEAETLRIPCNESLTDREVCYVIEKLHEFFR